MINHLTDSRTPRTAREAFDSDYYPPPRRSRKMRAVVWLLLIVSVVLALAACGGNNDDIDANARDKMPPPAPINCHATPEVCK